MRLFLLCIGVWFALLSPVAHASTREISGVSVDKNGVAVRGYDPVAYFNERKAVRGTKQWSVQIEGGITYLFSSESNRDAFAADPGRYAPQFGGFCAYGAATTGNKHTADPKAFAIVDGKLYLARDASAVAEFKSEAPGFIKKANLNWKPSPAK
jgi:YHS domain-containing protein